MLVTMRKHSGVVKHKSVARAWISIAAALALVMSGSVVACRTAPIREVIDAPLPRGQGASTTADVDEAIWRAGRKAGWKIERMRPGVLRGTWRFKRHLAVVSITHDDRRFNIRYEDSQNLLYSGEEIHRNYNKLVDRLVQQIQREPVTSLADDPQG
jgi:hypothetical protein